MHRTADVLVIGGGHNGLVAACYLARAGRSVTVLEAMPTLGGMSASSAMIPEAPEHIINTCAVDITFIRATQIVEELALRRYGYREVDVDPPNVYLHPDGASIALWRDTARTADEIRAFSRADAAAYIGLMETLNGLVDVALPVLTSHPYRPSRQLVAGLARAAFRQRRQLARLISLVLAPAAEVIDARFTHPVVRDALATQCGVGGPIDSPGSALNLILVPWWHRFGAGRPIGGTQALPDALEASLRSSGGEARTGAVISEILVRNGRVAGVRLEGGEELLADAVVATCDVRTALGKLLPAGTLSPKMESRVQHIPAYADGWAHLKIDVACSGRLGLSRYEQRRRDGLDLRIPSHIIGGFDQAIESYRQARAGQIPDDPCMWLGIPTGADPSQAPDGQDTLYLWVNGVPTASAVPWSTLADGAAKTMLERVGGIYDGLAELEIGRWVETPEDFAGRLRVTNGCLYHTDFSLFRLGPLRPALGLSGYATPVPGLFLGGSGSHPSPSVSGLPGKLAAEEVLRRSR